jgi:hypothetical protein
MTTASAAPASAQESAASMLRSCERNARAWTDAIANGEHAYADGWRTETFAGSGEGFVESMPWYFRTLSSWRAAIGEAGFRIERAREPIEAESGRPLSLRIVAAPDRGAAD